MNRKINNKRKWIQRITQALIILFVPLLVLAFIFQDGANGMFGENTLFPASLVMVAWVVVVVFGFSE